MLRRNLWHDPVGTKESVPSMHFLLTPIGSGGDVRPFVAIGRRLVQRGHEATLFAAEPFGPLATEAGLRFVSIWSTADYERQVLNPDLWHPRRGLRLVLDILTANLEANFAQVARVWLPTNSVLVAHSLAFATRAFAESHRVPSATIHLSPNLFRSRFEQPVMGPGKDLNVVPQLLRGPFWWMVDRLMLDPMIAPALNRFRQRHGLPPCRHVFRDAIHSRELVLGLFPPWFGAPQPDWPAQTRLTGFPLAPNSNEVVPTELDQWLGAGEPPLVFTPGTANRQAREFFAVATAAALRLKRRALLLTHWREQVPQDLPPEVRHLTYAPLTAMLHRCAAFVHHGGVGSSAQGLHAGVPQLLMPMGFDQPDNAARLVRLGVGSIIAPHRFHTDTVVRQLERLLTSPDVQQACHRWRERSTAASGIEAAGDALEGLSPRPSRT